MKYGWPFLKPYKLKTGLVTSPFLSKLIGPIGVSSFVETTRDTTAVREGKAPPPLPIARMIALAATCAAAYALALYGPISELYFARYALTNACAEGVWSHRARPSCSSCRRLARLPPSRDRPNHRRPCMPSYPSPTLNICLRINPPPVLVTPPKKTTSGLAASTLSSSDLKSCVFLAR